VDLQRLIDNAVKAERAKRLAESDQLTLGEIILKLEHIIEKKEAMIEKYENEPTVVFDFEYLYPNSINSWRGSYAELALGFESEKSEPMTITNFLNMLRSTVGKTFTGYKGGEFVMNKHTPVWVANYGNSGNTAVIEVVDGEYKVILMTGYRNY